MNGSREVARAPISAAESGNPANSSGANGRGPKFASPDTRRRPTTGGRTTADYLVSGCARPYPRSLARLFNTTRTYSEMRVLTVVDGIVVVVMAVDAAREITIFMEHAGSATCHLHGVLSAVHGVLCFPSCC